MSELSRKRAAMPAVSRRAPGPARTAPSAASIRAAGDDVAREAGLGPHPESKAGSGQDFASQTRRAGDYAARFAGLK